jgi:hypothetical protein
MDLKALHSILTKKGFYYFEGQTNPSSSDLNLYFSSGPRGRGTSCEIRIGDKDNDVHLRIRNINGPDIEYDLKNVNDNKIFKFIDEHIK